MKRLLVRSQYGHGLLADIQWREGRVDILAANPDMRASLERWTADGLREWLLPDDSLDWRFTASTSPDFLSRLAGYLGQQFGFETALYELFTAGTTMGLLVEGSRGESQSVLRVAPAA
jgi:hypothetical protein